ncbi:MAG: EAL domain-containing protein, partial [Actinomycetota bacterium]|nr:EAL domain-containing protein [Actinomycetota bacterium]
MTVGLTGYAVGFVLLFYVSAGEAGGPFGMNFSDCASLLLYPAGYVSLLLLTRARVRSWDAATVLDGAVVALSCAAAAVSWTAHSHPALLSGNAVNVVYALAYAVGGATLLVAALTGLAVTRWRFDATWTLLLAGFAVMTVGDAIYGAQTAAGTFRFGSPLDAVYAAGPVLISLAAWQRSDDQRRPGNAPVAMVVPGVATLVALTVLVLGHGASVPILGVALAAGAIVLAVARTAVFFRQDRLLAESRREAHTDDLTGLPNRRALLRLLDCALNDRSQVGLLLVDLDGFKEVNDALGHAAGDRLLVAIGDRLRPVGGLGVARLGGDEFAIVVDGGHVDPRAHAATIRRLIGAAVTVDGCRITVDASIGVVDNAARERNGLTSGELLRRADVALYRAKRQRTGVEVWSECLDVGVRERLVLVEELRAALTDDEIIVHYQPKVQPHLRSVQSLEALVRWQHPRRGLLGPGAFLDAAEQGGLMPLLTRRVLSLVLERQVQCTSEGTDAGSIAVNVSAPDLLDPEFASYVAGQLRRYDLDPGCLRMEVTETVVMSDPDRIMTTLTELKALGVGLSLDDYGTGLSSLSYVRALPIDELKIDQSFVQSMTIDRASALIVA